MELYESIRRASEILGDLFLQDMKFLNILSDLRAINSDNAGKHILTQLYRDGFLQVFYKYCCSKENKSEQEIRLEIVSDSYQMSQKYAFKQDNVMYCLEHFCYAFDLISSITSAFDNSPQEDVKVVGNWDFTYHNDKTMQLAISRDGIARASSGTKYNWKLSGSNIEIFIEGMVSYKGLVAYGLMNGTATSVYNPNAWPWSAKKRNDGLTVEDLISGSWTIVNDVDDLEDNKVSFLHDNIINSDLYGQGKWSLDGDQLVIITANDFIKYTAKFIKGEIVGKGRNRIADEWNFKLLKNN